MGGKTTTVQNNDPWAPAQPFILQGLDQTNQVFKDNQQPLQNMSDVAYDAYKQIAPTAFTPNANITQAQNIASSVNGGTFLGANPGQSTYAATMAGGPNPATAGLSSLAATGGATSPSAQYYSDVLGGKYLNGNPYLDSVVSQGTDAATKAVNQRMAASGMGAGVSTPYTGLLAKNVEDASNSLRFTDYNNQMDRMTQVGGQADAQTNAGNQIRLNAGTAAGNLYNQDQQLKMGAASQADAVRSDQVNQMLQAGSSQSGLAQGQFAGVSPALSLLSEAASIPYTGIAAYNGGITGLSSGYGTQTSTQDQDFTSGMTGLLGSGLSGWASGGFKGLSDRRAKTLITKIADLADGLGVYAYRYIFGGPPQMGVMADEVAQLRPWALGPKIGGFATVNYEAL
jgi:hypothetical protein